MIAFSHAKINLGLFVMNKRPDGFHALESVFWPVDWTDVLEVHAKPSPGLELKITGLEVPGNLESNLIAKAYELMAREFNIGGVTAHLHKSHPNGSRSGRWQLQCNVHDSIARSAFFTESNRRGGLATGSSTRIGLPVFLEVSPRTCHGKGRTPRTGSRNPVRKLEQHALDGNPSRRSCLNLGSFCRLRTQNADLGLDKTFGSPPEKLVAMAPK